MLPPLLNVPLRGARDAGLRTRIERRFAALVRVGMQTGGLGVGPQGPVVPTTDPFALPVEILAVVLSNLAGMPGDAGELLSEEDRKKRVLMHRRVVLCAELQPYQHMFVGDEDAPAPMNAAHYRWLTALFHAACIVCQWDNPAPTVGADGPALAWMRHFFSNCRTEFASPKKPKEEAPSPGAPGAPKRPRYEGTGGPGATPKTLIFGS